MSTISLDATSMWELYGSVYFGVVMSTALYGVACMQTFFYYVHYEKDPLRTKILVGLLWTLNTIHEVLSVAGGYKYLLNGLVNGPSSSVFAIPELILSNLFTALAAVPTQTFLVYRIYVFSGKKIIVPIIYCLLGPVELVGCVIFVSHTLYISNGVLRAAEINVLDSPLNVIVGTLVLSLSVLIDVCIAIVMTTMLVYHWSHMKTSTTAHMLQSLMVLSVNTGTWTAVIALLTVILIHVSPRTWLSMMTLGPLCSIYCNTLLANLNARAYVLRSTEMAHDHNHIQLGLELMSGASSSRAACADDGGGGGGGGSGSANDNENQLAHQHQHDNGNGGLRVVDPKRRRTASQMSSVVFAQRKTIELETYPETQSTPSHSQGSML